jgi:hypothetical protein
MAHLPDDLDDLPDPLKADLAQLFRADLKPSPAADQALLSRARAYFAGMRKRQRRMRVLEYAIGAAIAAAVILVVVPMSRTDGNMGAGRARAQAQMEARGDLNYDGITDIRDAMLLARRIDAKQSHEINDYNQDKVVDKRDVDAIAMIAVRLDGGTTR